MKIKKKVLQKIISFASTALILLNSFTPYLLIVPTFNSVKAQEEIVTPTAEPTAIPTVTPEPVPPQAPSQWTFEKVELKREYVSPQNSEVKLTFTKLPDPSGNIKIEEITLTEDQIKQTGSLSNKAYDITSDMKDGDFSYNLSLPIPESSKGKSVEVKFAEEISNIDSAKKVDNTLTKTDTSVSVTSLDHMTIFVITNGGSNGSVTPPSCTGATGSVNSVTITGSDQCFNSIQAAITAASPGETINVAAGTYVENVSVTKDLTLQGVAGTNLQGKITISHNGVTIDGFNITNPSVGYGIIATDYSNLTITNNTIHDIGTTLTGGSAQAITVISNSVTVTDVTISENHISNVGNLTLINSGSGSAKGIYIGNSNGSMDFDGVTINHNDIINVRADGTHTYGAGGRGAYGILVNHDNHSGAGYGSTKNLTISNNTISNLDGLFSHAIGLEGNTPSAVVTGNTITNLIEHKQDLEGSFDAFAVRLEDNPSASTVSGTGNTFVSKSIVFENTSVFVDPSISSFTSTLHPEVLLNDSYYYAGINAFSKIQDAVAGVAADGTINVAAGTYIEAGQIVINKNLSIIGADKITTIIKPAQDTGSADDLRGWFLVNSGKNFTLKNVTLDGTGHKIFQAIRSHGPLTIENNVIKNMLYDPSTSYEGRGVVAYDGFSSNILNNTLENIGRIGIFIYGAGTQALVNGNTYVGKGTGTWLDYGVEIGGGGQATVENNNISNNKGVAGDGSTSAGIYVTTYFAGGTTATITGNTLTDNTDGITVGYDAEDTSVVVVHNNKLEGNVTGINSTHPTVNATENWWGDQSGPDGQGTGIGDNVSANVTFSPWCLTSDCSTYSSIYSNSKGVNLGTSQDVTVGDLTLENVTGTGSLFVAKYDGIPSTGGLSTGVDGFYYDIQATGINFPVSITLSYSDTLGASNYLDENHFSSLYYYKDSSWHDYKLDTPPSTISINKTTNKITATLQHLTPIVPVIDTTAPTVPDLTAPTNNGYVVTNNFDFTWNDSTDASIITYEYQASLNPASTDGILTTGLWHSGVLPTAMIHSSGASDGKWYWQVRAIDSVGNTSAWSAIWNVTIDTTAPPVPTHISPANGAFKTTASLTSVDWSDVIDINGPVSYYYQSSLSSAINPDGSFVTPAYTSGALATSNISAGGTPQNTYYWHVRAKDVPGNLSAWSSAWSIIVDNTAPSSDPSGFSSSPAISTPSNDQTVTVSWTTGGVDALSGVDGYSYSFTNGSTDVPDNIKDIEETTTNVTSLTLADGTWYFHIRTVDNAGNWTSTAHYGPFTIETVLPTLTPVSIVSNNSNPIYAKTGDAITLTFTSSETVNTPTVTILGHTATVSNLGGNNWQAAYVTTGSETEGIAPFTINFIDIAGNNGVQVTATTDSSAVTYDNTNPTNPGTPSTTTPTNSTTQGWSWAAAVDTISGILRYAWRVGGGGPSGTVLGTSTTATTNLLEGIWNFFVKAIDNAGNESAESEGTVTVDTTPPSAPTPLTPGDIDAIKGIAFDQTWTNESASGAVLYGYQSCYSNPGDAGGSCGSVKSTSTYSGTTKHVGAGQPNSHFWWRVRAKDTAGNWSNYGSAFELIIDNSAPNISLNAPTSPTNDTTPSFTGTSSDVYDAGVNLVEYQVDSGSWTLATGTNSFSFTTGVLTPGVHTVSARATDRAGNISSSSPQSITIDTTEPNISADNSSTSWRTANITITLSVSDTGGAGLKTAKYNWDSPATASVGTDFTDGNTITIPSDGSHTLYLYADDNADNSNTFSGTYKLDTVNPTTADSGIDANWHNTDVTVTLTCSDNGSGSGCANTYYTTNGSTPTTSSLTSNPFTLTTNGNYIIKYFSVDAAGNVESVKTAADTVNIDKTKPTSTISTPTNNGTNSVVYSSSWNGSVSGTATDNLSGVNDVQVSIQKGTTQYFDGTNFITTGSEILLDASYSGGNWSYAGLTSPADGSYTIKSHAIDNATNMESTYTLTIILDKTIPEVMISLNPAVADASNGWYKTQPEITLTATDTNKDIIEYQWNSETGSWTTYSAPFKPGSEGEYVLYYRARDLANNYSGVGIKNIKWDQTELTDGPLNVSVSPNPTSGTTSVVKWEEAKDNVGIDRYEIKWSLKNGDKSYTESVGSNMREKTINNLIEGDWTIEVKAFDWSGKSKSASTDLTVDRTGPSAPTLSIFGTAVGSVSLSWSKVDGASDYIIWYGTNPGSYQYGAKVGDTQGYTVQGLGAGSYYFIVKAMDPSGNQSGNSNEVSSGTIVGAPGVGENTPAQGFAAEVLGEATGSAQLTPTGSVLGTESTKNGKKKMLWWQWVLLLLLPTGGWFGYVKWKKKIPN